MLNKIILIGRLTRDPELKFTSQNSKPVTNFTLAVDRPFKNQKGEYEADFIKIVTWNNLAEICADNLTKGRLVAVSGRLQIRSYDGEDGQRKTIAEVVAEEVRFLDKPKDKEEPTFEDVQENTDGVPF
jgi:single-strand DNA-binding protein